MESRSNIVYSYLFKDFPCVLLKDDSSLDEVTFRVLLHLKETINENGDMESMLHLEGRRM